MSFTAGADEKHMRELLSVKVSFDLYLPSFLCTKTDEPSLPTVSHYAFHARRHDCQGGFLQRSADRWGGVVDTSQKLDVSLLAKNG